MEKGKMNTAEADAAVAGYLREFDGFALDGLVLGCTHYPLLASSIRKVLGDGVPLINPAHNTAIQIKQILDDGDLRCAPESTPEIIYCTSGDQVAFGDFIRSTFQVTNPRIERIDARV